MLRPLSFIPSPKLFFFKNPREFRHLLKPEGARSPGARVKGGSLLPDVNAGNNSDPREEQCILLTAEPSLTPSAL